MYQRRVVHLCIGNVEAALLSISLSFNIVTLALLRRVPFLIVF